MPNRSPQEARKIDLINSITIQEQKLDQSQTLQNEPEAGKGKYTIDRSNYNSAANVAGRINNLKNFNNAKL